MGMEHQTAIAYGNKYKNFYYYDFDHIILHETAHEWWGNSLTAADMQDVWLQEGFATYSEALYVEDHYSYKEYLKYLSLYRIMIKNNHPVLGPSGVDYFSYKDTDVYMKGCWFLHTLRGALNDDALFFDILKSFATRYREKTVCTKDFLNVVNEKTKSDYKWLFDQYLKTRDVPELQVSIAKEEGTNLYKLYYRWENVVEGFKMPATVILTYGGKYHTKLRLNPETLWGSVKLSPENGQTKPGIIFNPNDGYYTLRTFKGNP